MLEEISTTEFQGSVFRLVNQALHVELLTEMGLSSEDIEEMVALLRDRGITDDPSKVLDGPFEAKPLLGAMQTRFSDGNIRVFYSALEPETTEREIRYWYLKPLLSGQRPITVYYRLVRCSFQGQVKDLRARVKDWPFLISDDGYGQCNVLGAEAAAAGLGGLLSQSARHPPGTTLPVFRRRCLSDVVFQEYRAFRYDPTTGDVVITIASAH